MRAKPTVLFLCPHGAAKSVLAAADFNRLAAAWGVPFMADSAGTEPDAEPAPAVVAALGADGIDVSAHRPRLVTGEDLDRAHRVVALGCEPQALPRSTARVVHWNDVPPVSLDLEALRKVIRRHLDDLVRELAEDRRSPSL